MVLRIFIFLLLMLTPLNASAGVARIDRDLRQAMVPHKALYDIQMVSKHSSSQILNIKGQMFFEWRPECEAWMTNHRFNLHYEYADSAPMQITSDFNTYESYDGKSFDFSSRRKRNGELYQELRGRGTLGPDGKGQSVYTLPADLTYDLPANSLFPMAHTIGLLRHIQEGNKFFSAAVFDGSDEDGPVEINSFIGKPVKASDIVPAGKTIDAGLLASPAWKVRMAFFPVTNENAQADYEMDVIFHDNSVISDMVVEYSDFTVAQRLVALEKLAAVPCDAPESEASQKPAKPQ